MGLDQYRTLSLNSQFSNFIEIALNSFVIYWTWTLILNNTLNLKNFCRDGADKIGRKVHELILEEALFGKGEKEFNCSSSFLICCFVYLRLKPFQQLT